MASTRCIALVAPTASGKTELSIALAERFGFEIVSMDSAMVYRGMDIGTAKPPIETRAGIPHHLIDIVEPDERYSAGRFAAEAADAIADIATRGKPALIVGGTLLYLRALRDGLADLPAADHDVRREIDEEAAKQGWPAMHERLAHIDPQSAGKIAPGDRQRIQRALEVHRLTGQALSVLQKEALPGRQIDVRVIALVPADRQALARRIETRFDAMLAAGFVEEVERLRARGDLNRELPSMRSVGYRQIWAYLEGEYSLAEARDRGVIATRQLAKRQLTWLRGEVSDCRITDVGAAVEAQVFTEVEHAFDSGA